MSSWAIGAGAGELDLTLGHHSGMQFIAHLGVGIKFDIPCETLRLSSKPIPVIYRKLACALEFVLSLGALCHKFRMSPSKR